jgi:hypothetical protein
MTASNNPRSSYSRLLAAEVERNPPPAAPGQSSEDAFLAERAEQIRSLGKRVIGDVIEIGKLLTEVRGRIPHGQWKPWLEREFGWSDETARRYMSLHKLGQQNPQIVDYDIPVSGLYLLAAPSTPEAARDEVITRAGNGEHLQHEQVREVVDQHRVRQRRRPPAEEETAAQEEQQQEPVIPLSATAQQRLDAAIRKATRRLEVEFERRLREQVQDQVTRDINEYVLPSWRERLTKAETLLRSRRGRGVLSANEYRSILSCLHPDRVEDATLKARYTKAFHIFQRVKVALLGEVDDPTTPLATAVPRTRAEWQVTRQQRSATAKASAAARAVVRR